MKQSLFIALALLWAFPALADPLSHYTVHRASTPIRVDGHLDEFAWESAEQINRFERILNDYDQVTRPTRAKMLWDDQHCYFAFVCQDPDMWTLYTQEDEALWEEEVVEVFIDPDGDGRDYLELEVNPRNVKVDLRVRRLEPQWESSIPWDIAGLKTAVQTYGTVDDSLSQDLGWTVEIAIPWAAMADSIGGGGNPEVGDTWRLNLYRIERRAGRQAKGQEHFHQQTEYTAWSETYQRGFHHPARFGVVEFGE